MIRGAKLVAIASLAALALTACGKRGALEPPSKAEHANKSGESKSSSVEPRPDESPHRPFVLDPLLR